MQRDKLSIYILSVLTFAAVLPLLFLDFSTAAITRIITAAVLVVMTVAACMVIRRRRAVSIRTRDVLLLHLALVVLLAIALHMTGLHFGYYKNPYYPVNAKLWKQTLIPVAVIIITTEIIRAVFLAQKNKLASLSAFLTAVAAEVLMVSGLANLTSFNRFMDVVGLTLLPAAIGNVYYHYATKRYGALPNILLRLILSLYTYFLPTTSAMPDALQSCVRILFPLILLAVVSSLYEKKRKIALPKKGQKLGWFATALTVAACIAVAMLISCRFRFGALVIATESMTGEINKGDMILYERYENQPIQEGQVVVFLNNEARIVHRVVKIETVKGETRYYTKGDANDSPDAGYRTKDDIFGLTDVKLAYVGYPTLWLRELVTNTK
jgi:signal peptidase